MKNPRGIGYDDNNHYYRNNNFCFYTIRLDRCIQILCGEIMNKDERPKDNIIICISRYLLAAIILLTMLPLLHMVIIAYKLLGWDKK